jgi:hypothetical protein
MKLHLAVITGTLLFAGLAGAATSYPTQDRRAESAQSASGSHLDFTACAFPEAKDAAQAQIDASLRLPASERGAALAGGPCSVGSTPPAPTRVDERYRR